MRGSRFEGVTRGSLGTRAQTSQQVSHNYAEASERLAPSFDPRGEGATSPWLAGGAGRTIDTERDAFVAPDLPPPAMEVYKPLTRMIRNRLFAIAAAAAAFSAWPVLHAQEAVPAPAPAEAAASAAPARKIHPVPQEDELRALRQVVEAQTKRIEALAEQVLLLRKKLEGEGENVASRPAEPAPAPAEVAPAPPTAPAPAEIPRAEATGGGIKHIVAKGETLTSIAKQYNISIADLQKANKVQNDRKLQIGQVLSIPTTPEPAPDKKENP